MAHTGRTARGSDNEALLDRLARAVAAADPPPRALEASARELLAWRTVDAELSALLGDGCAHTPTAMD
jgi:hypothetical protein